VNGLTQWIMIHEEVSGSFDLNKWTI